MPLTKLIVKPVLIAALLSGTLAIAAPKARGNEMSTNNKQTLVASQSCPDLLKGTYPKLQDETPQSLCQYAGKVVLVVNTASYCGFTRQYDGLERLYDRFRSQGLVVLGFPSNDFGQHEPDSNKKIADFCHNTYGIKFPMFAKSSVRGSNANPLFKQLAQLTGDSPSWNFHKYLISRDGRKVLSFGSQIAPESKTMIEAIEQMLKSTP
ncbi:MAG: Glutathione peroxidase [Fluviibacter phosphoraccumulans EoVTN8]